MYNYSYGDTYSAAESAANSFAGSAIWLLISLIIAIIGGIVVYFVFFKPDKELPNKFLNWCKEFFCFRKMLVEDMLKVIYTILAIFITLGSFSFITVNFVTFLLVLILGNILLRLGFELSLINIMIWKNTNDINKKLKTNKKED